MTDPLHNRILYALFCLSRDTRRISATTLSEAAGCTATQAADALVALERAGLVDATRARLTMLGLAKAAAGGTDLGAAGLWQATGAGPRPCSEPPAPLAANPVQPLEI